MNVIKIPATTDTKPIDDKIKGILSRGNIACFTNWITGVVKHVTKWNPAELGDLTASYSTGSTKYVCPYSFQYDITEIKKAKKTKKTKKARKTKKNT